ncbi:MAG: two-component regulator propeller domain-containing protein [Bacteroidota bacterium]
MSRRTHVVAALLLLAAVSPARAQQTLLFEHLTVKEGLSQGTVISIFQDARGFMWFGTQDGLNRYDGYECKVFKSKNEDPSSLNDNFIVAVVEDSSSALWIETLNSPATLNRYDPATETFTQVPRDSVNLVGARRGAVHPSYVDPAGVQWSGSLGGGLTRFDPATGTQKVYRHDPARPSSLADDRVYSVVGDSDGIIWLGTREGLDRFDPRTESFIHYRHDPNDPGSLSDNWVWPILEDASGVLWVGTFNGGLNRFDRSTGTFAHVRHDQSDPRSLAGDRLYALAQDRSGTIWVGTGDHGADRFHPGLSAFRHYRHDPRNERSLVDNNVTALHADRSGIAWIGTQRGLQRWDPASGQFAGPGVGAPSWTDIIVESFAEDEGGSLWMGTLSGGLVHMERNGGQITRYTHNPDRPTTISDNRVYALTFDPSGDLWIGTYGGGLNRLDRKRMVFQRFTHNDSTPGSLGAAGVWSLLMDRSGTLWVGTYGGGLDRFDRATGTFTHFRHEAGVPGRISDNIILCLHEDRSGTLWAGTVAGLNRLDRERGTFSVYREEDGLPNNTVYGILEDSHGNLWLSTNKGLSVFEPRNGVFRNFTEHDGLQADEFNQNAYAQSPRTGEMYFGGANGFNVFHPDSIRTNDFVPPIVFTSFLRYNTDDEEGKPIFEPGIAVRPHITLSYKDNIAAIEFAALSYYNTLRNQYAYLFEGFSANWIRIGTERRATFTNLDAGEYTLRVRGSNGDGLWNEEGASLRITVTPPWWKSRWAYSAYAVMITGFLYGIRTVEIKRREQKARIRESELRAKAAEAESRALEAENARKTKELEDARRLQLSMLPKEVPSLPNFEISVYMKTATEVGGDFYDFHLAEDRTLNIAFGDATGHGMQAGTIVTLMKGLFVSDVGRFDTRAFLDHCSAAIKEIKMGRLFMAFTLARLRDHSVELSSAGMPPAYVYRRADGSVDEILVKGMPLGAMKRPHYECQSTALAPGDVLLLMTDGLPEQKNTHGEMYDYPRVREAFRSAGEQSPGEMIRHLVRAGESWMGSALQEDDMTLLAIKCTG